MCSIDQEYDLLSEQQPPPFGSSIVLPLTGNVYPTEYFSVSLQIGHQPKAFNMEMTLAVSEHGFGVGSV